MEEKDLKKALDELGDKIDTKLEKYSRELSELTEEKARKAALEEIKKALEPEMAKYTKMQEQLDGIETSLKRNINAEMRKTFEQQLREKIGTGGRELKGKRFVFDTKVDDMLESNSFESTTVVPYDQKPGIVFDPDRTVHARDLIAQGRTSSNVVSFVQEYAESFSTYIAQTAEGAEKKQVDFDLKMVSANVIKITGYLIISEEMLEDVEGLMSYILTRLPSKIRMAEDAFILRDTTYGLQGKATAYTDPFADADINMYDVIVAALTAIKVYNYAPNFVLMHPTDVMKMKLEKDDNGQYIYPWIFLGGRPTVDGIRIFESAMITAGCFLVGDGTLGAQVFDKHQLEIEFTNTNEDNFIKDMVTVRGHERLALAVYRPHAFIYGTFATALASGSL